MYINIYKYRFLQKPARFSLYKQHALCIQIAFDFGKHLVRIEEEFCIPEAWRTLTFRTFTRTQRSIARGWPSSSSSDGILVAIAMTTALATDPLLPGLARALDFSALGPRLPDERWMADDFSSPPTATAGERCSAGACCSVSSNDSGPKSRYRGGICDGGYVPVGVPPYHSSMCGSSASDLSTNLEFSCRGNPSLSVAVAR
jgi:hypothetical protein